MCNPDNENQNKFYIWSRLQLKRKINLAKGPRKIKRIGIKIGVKTKNNVLIEWWNWKE
jgi:hypothetical protein